MTKAVQATCENGVVTVDGKTITPDFILSGGVSSSQGVLIIDGPKSYYVAKTSADLQTIIEKTSDAINKIAEILTAIGAGMTGPTTAPPGTLATDVTELQTTAMELEDLGESLL